jgi:flagellar protein FliJ
MSIVSNLLRLHRWQLEERRRYLAELESLAGRLRADTVRLTADTNFEPANSLEQDNSGSRVLTRSLVERCNRLEHSIAEIETQIVEARAAVAVAESEVAHYEAAAAPRSSMGSGGAGRVHRRVQDRVPYRLRHRGA